MSAAWVPHQITAQATFQPLGQLPGGYASYANAVSADGSTVVGRAVRSDGNDEAFRWRDGPIQGLGDVPGGTFDSEAVGVSADGGVVVGRGAGAGGTTAFRWTMGGGMQSLSHLSNTEPVSEAHATSADGSVVVGFSGGQAFGWTAGGMVDLGNIPPYIGSSAAHGVSADGSVIVGASTNDAFRWTPAGGMVGLGLSTLDCYASAQDVSADGNTLVGFVTCVYAICDLDDCSYHYTSTPFRWTAQSGAVNIAANTGNDQYALGISSDGLVAVGYETYYEWFSGNTVFTALIWDAENGMRSLRQVLVDQYGLGSQLAGWRLGSATGISDDGRVIVGWGTNPSSAREAFRVVLPVAPGPMPAVTAWRSLRMHAAIGSLGIALNPAALGSGSAGPTVETRQGGIQKIEVDFNQPVTISNPSAVSVTGQRTIGGTLQPPVDYSAAATTASVDADTIAMTFAPGALPEETCYRINLAAAGILSLRGGLAGDADCSLRSLLADGTGSGDATLSDALFTKRHIGRSAAVLPQLDFDLSGTITQADALLAKSRVIKPDGKVLCPDQACSPGNTVCGGQCVYLPEDPQNCGSCGNVCALGTSCMGGSCQPNG